MTSESLLAAIERQENLADSYGNLADDRAKALDYYLGRPMGNEVEGRSQVVSRDVWDTVEWIKPQIAEIFCGGDQVVLFTPRGPEDVQAAEQETEFVNYVITEKNDWFTVFTGWQHDALLQKTGYVVAYYDEREDRTKEKYCDLSADELALLLQDPDVEIIEGEQEEDGTYEVTLERKSEYGCAKFENVPPERVLVGVNARGLNLQDPRLDFCEYWEYKSVSQLRDEGFDVPDDISDHSSNEDWEDQNRDELNPFKNREGEESSPAARQLKVRNVWIRYDGNDDGLTELRRVVVVGTTILSDEECDEVTLYALSPIPLPHQHNGLSVADAVLDLQDIKTALLRGTLDNVYLANNGRHAIDVNRVNLDDMLVSRPGGVVRVDGSLGDAIMPLQHSTTGNVAVPVMEYVDRIASKRTGVSEAMQGLNSNSLNNSLGAGTNQAIVSAAQQRIKFIARTFAETGIKALFRGIHALTLKHARKPEIVRLRNRWVPVDPRHWKKRADMTISVGLGQGDKAAQMMFLQNVLQIQAQAAPFGLASPVKVYNTLKRLTQAAGYKDPNEFWDDPSTQPPRPPQPNPEVVKEQAKAQAQAAIKAQEIQAQVMLKREENALRMQELQANLQLQASNDMRDSERERWKGELQAQIDAQKLQLEQWKATLEADMKKYTNDQDNAVKLQIAGMTAEKQTESQLLQIGHDAAQKDAERQATRTQDMTKEEAEKLIGGTLSQVTKALAQLADMQKQMAEGQKNLENAVKAKRVLVRGPDGRPTHSEIAN